MDCMSMILDKALELGLDRKCTFVALGGGVIGDMVGFASAIYLRGVNFIQVRAQHNIIFKCLYHDFVQKLSMELHDILYQSNLNR